MLFRLPEAYLNKAEAQAILGDESGAKQTLNVLREKRFLAENMPAIESRDGCQRGEFGGFRPERAASGALLRGTPVV